MTLLVWQQEGHPACKKVKRWFVGGNDLTGALHVLYLQLSPPLPSFLAPINGLSGKMAIKTERERGTVLVRCSSWCHQ